MSDPRNPVRSLARDVETGNVVDLGVLGDQRLAAVDAACARALVIGRYGVSVRTFVSVGQVTTEAWVDPQVPYGEVHDHGVVGED